MKNEKIKCFIFGVGKYWSFAERLLSEKVEIAGLVDNNRGGKNGVCSPEELRESSFDKVLICVADFPGKLQIMNQLLDLGIEKSKIGFIEEFRKYYSIDKIEVIEKDTVDMYKNGIVIRCENAIEYMIAEEILIKEEYGFHSKEDYFVIDVGMNIGCASLYFAAKENIAAVYGFEPCIDVYDKAIQNIAKSCADISRKIKIFSIGLGGKDDRKQYERLSESGGIKKVQDGERHGSDIMEIDEKRASDVLGKIFSEHKEKCLMKLDCEGAEYEILWDLIYTGLIERVDEIIMEWHAGKYELLEQLLKKAGFKYILNKGRNDYGKCYAWR